jgi:penicillin amidase
VPEDLIRIHRDATGTPHVQATTDDGAFYGLGWATASDRRFQLALTARAVQGRLSEVLGAEYVDEDREARVMMLWKAAQRKAEGLDAETVALLQAYADGINAWTKAQDSLPLLDEAGIVPDHWTVAHVLASWHALARHFSIGAQKEANLRVDFDADAAKLGEDAAVEAWLDSLHPGVPSAGVVQLGDIDEDYVNAVNDYAASVGYGVGDVRTMIASPEEGPHFSHVFAVSGKRTASGKALLVADPQLAVQLPSTWYEFQLESPSFRVRGVGVPGSPGIAIGFNEHVAWGITAGGGDQSDLFRLELGHEADTYVVDGVTYAMGVSSEVIEVRDGADVPVTVRETRLGPVLDPVLDDTFGSSWALASVLTSEVDRDTIVGMLGMMKSDSLDAFTDALEEWRAPSVNLVAATDDGEVYYSVIGGIPVRSLASPLGGWVAQDGSTWDTAWIETIPHVVLPQVTTPEDGVVFSGNHRAAGDWYPLPLHLPVNTGGHTTRSARIRDQLASRDEWTAKSLMLGVQRDCTDHAVFRLLEVGRHVQVVAPRALSPEAVAVLNELDGWDGSMRSHLVGPTLGRAMPTNFRVGETGELLQDLYYGGQGGMQFFLDTMLAAIAADPRFVPSPEALVYIDTVFAAAEPELATPAHERVAAWQAEVATVTLDWMSLYDGTDVGSDLSVTSEVLPCAWGASIWSQVGQSYSHLVDFGGRDGSLLPVGVSEDPESGTMTSQLGQWEVGRFKPAPLTPRDVAAVTRSTETVSR